MIGAEQASLIADGRAHAAAEGRDIDVAHDAGDHVALVSDGTDNDGPASSATAFTVLGPNLVLSLAADLGVIDFDNAAQFLFRLDKRSSDFVVRQPSAFDGSEPIYRPS